MIAAVAHRELISASRKASVYWTRLTVTAACLVFCGLLQLVVGGGALGDSGQAVFFGLSVFALAYCLMCGLWTTADSISSERREGTLPLLYLTRLTGGGLLAGKLTATSLSAFYGLVAMFPVLAIPLLAGGISGVQMWATSLMLITTLVFSLSAGLLASAIAVREQSAVFLTVVLVMGLTLGGVMLGLLVLFVLIFSQIEQHSAKMRAYLPWLGMFVILVAFGLWSFFAFGKIFLGSPLAAWFFIMDYVLWSSPEFHSSLGVTWAFTAFYAYSAKVCSEWGIRDRELEAAGHTSLSEDGVPELRYNYEALRDRNPVQWFLVMAGPGRLFLGAAVVLPAFFVWAVPLGFGGMHVSPGIALVSTLAHMLLAFALARQGGWFFEEARKTGLLEVLLTTPVTLKQLTEQQIRACWIVSKHAVAVLMLLQAGGCVLFYTERFDFAVAALVASLGIAMTLLTVHASFTTGIFFVLKGKRANTAALLTMLLVAVAPMMVANLMPTPGFRWSNGRFMSMFFLQGFVIGAYYLVLIRVTRSVKKPRLVLGSSSGGLQERAS